MTTSRGTHVVHVGARVMSADGKQLGVVKEARADRFHVDVRWAPDYWLGTELIENSSEEILQVTVRKEDLGTAKLHGSVEGPGMEHADEIGGPSPTNRPPPTI
jgi:hypothetical protein